MLRQENRGAVICFNRFIAMAGQNHVPIIRQILRYFYCQLRPLVGGKSMRPETDFLAIGFD